MSSGKSVNAGGDEKKKKKVKDKSQGQGQPEIVIIDESHREFYLIQIKDLEDRITKLQKICDEMDATNCQLQEKFSKNSDDQQDIVAYIQKKLSEKEAEVCNAQEVVNELEKSMNAERSQFESQYEQILTEFNTTKEQLQHENSTLATKLASLDDLRAHREELEEKISGLEEALMKQAKDHTDAKYNLEKFHIMTKDRLKKEMQDQIDSMSKKFRESSNDQLVNTTKIAIESNVQISKKLDLISHLSSQQLNDNEAILRQVRETKIKKEILEENARQLNNKYNYYTDKLNQYKSKFDRLQNEENLSRDATNSSRTESATKKGCDEISHRLKLPSLCSSRTSLCSSAN